jgi:hypothetical protein
MWRDITNRDIYRTNTTLVLGDYNLAAGWFTLTFVISLYRSLSF